MSDYFCTLHTDVRATEDEYGKGFTTCLKCGQALKKIESDETKVCWKCGRDVKAVWNRLEDRIDGVCTACKAVYSVKL